MVSINDILISNLLNCSDNKERYSRDPNKRTGGNRRTGKKLDQELINVQEVINVQGKITSNLFFSLIGKVSDIFRT